MQLLKSELSVFFSRVEEGSSIRNIPEWTPAQQEQFEINVETLITFHNTAYMKLEGFTC